MAEINISSHEKAPKRKVLSTRVDLTPMVDLGFLLITFFIFTTKMGEPTTMELAVPKESIKDSMKIADTKTLNFILSGDDSLYYYEGSATMKARR
jgi:biopolymer transport protein ExbD